MLKPNSQCDGIKLGAFGRWLGPEGRALMNGISALSKEAPENYLAPSTLWGHTEKSVTLKTALTRPCWHPDLGHPVRRAVRSRFLWFLSHQVCGLWYFVLTAQMDWDTLLSSLYFSLRALRQEPITVCLVIEDVWHPSSTIDLVRAVPSLGYPLPYIPRAWPVPAGE